MRGRLSYANVVASLALFVALGGTSYAVIKLPRNSVGSREIKNRSIRAGDIAVGVVKKSVRGPRGSAGATGAPGATGPRGPSDVITASRTNVPLPLAGGAAADIVTLSVPAGNWWFLGTGSAVYEGPGAAGADNFYCGLVYGGTPGATAGLARIGLSADAALAGDITVQEGQVLAGPTLVRLRCSHVVGLPGGGPRFDYAQLTAIRTESLDIQPG